MKLKKAIDDLNVAKLLISPVGNPTNDEGLYDLAAYHAQQAMEKTIKYVLHDICGIDDTTRKFRTHDISSLIDMIESMDNSELILCIPEHLKLMASDISGWEANSRYCDNMCIVKKDIEDVLSMCQELIAQIRAYELCAETDESDTQ